MMLCAFPPSSRPLSIQADVLLSSLSLSTPVGRFDGSGSPSPHPFFPSSTLSPSRERCMHDRSVSAPHRHVLFLFLICCRHRSSNDTALEQCLSKSSTKSEIPAVIIFCIIASAGTSLSKSYTSKKAEHLTHPCWPFLGKTKTNNDSVFFLIIGSFLLYYYVRQKRERTRRNEHREKVWQFRDMQRSGLGPTLTADSKDKAGTPIQISYPVLMSEASTSPRYPAKSFYW